MSRWYAARIHVCLVLLLLAFGGLLARAVLLQVRDGERLARLAARQATRDIEVAARRGPIYDRSGVPLALSVEVESIYARPRRLQPADVPRLAATLDMPAVELRARLKTSRPFVWLRRQVSPAMAARVRAMELPGVGFVTEHRRFYPNGPVAGHVVGFAGLDGQGLEGIERAYDAVIRGDVAHRAESRDARGRGLLPEGLDPEAVSPEGNALVLTIDRRLQFAAERALGEAVETAGAAGGIAVVLDPATGEVLVMANVPEFDPNRFAEARPAAWRNRAVTDVFEPGSTIKAFLAAAALEAAVVDAADVFYAERGVYRIGGRTVRDAYPAEWLTLSQILRVSSNIGAIKVAERVGPRRYRRMLAEFGFGRRTGIDLPGEVEGTLGPAGEWPAVTLATASYGYGLAVTPIQLAAAFAAIANDGAAVPPRVVRGIRLADGRVVPFGDEVRSRKEVVRRVIAPETARRLTSMLEAVVAPGGTGQQAALAGYAVAGKTGTARKVEERGGYADGRYVSSFVGFVPADAPRFVIAVFIDEPKGSIYGGAVAAPAFRAIAEAALTAYRVPPAGPVGPAPHVPAPGDAGRVILASAEHPPAFPQPPADGYSGPTGPRQTGPGRAAPAAVAEAREPGRIPDLTHLGMREVLQFARDRGLVVEVEGSGWVVSQRPAPGAPWPRDARLWVKFAP